MSIATRLAEYLGRYDAARFDWASAHCCHFAAEWVSSIEGVAPMDGLRVTPDVRAAIELARELGGLEAAITRQLGRAPVSPAFAQVGDVVLFRGDGPCGGTVGICAGRTAVVVLESGTAHLPVSQASHAWRLRC